MLARMGHRWIALCLFAASALMAQTAEQCCAVVITIRNPERLPIPQAAVRIESGAIRYNGNTGPEGEWKLSLRTPGTYRVMVTAPGYAGQVSEFSVARDETARVELVLPRRETVTVEGQSSRLDPAANANQATRDQIRSLPERVADVRNALPLIPGVVRTPEGRLQIAGSPEHRSTFLVNSVDVTDPATGSFGATVPIDVIETVQVYKSPFLAEYGRFSAAVVAVTTRRGGDQWHGEVNDPTPEFRIRSGHLRGIRGFTPRVAGTGPVIAGKLFFSGAGSFELRKRPVYPLPFPHNEEKSQRVNAYVQLDYIPQSSRLITLSLHGVPQRSDFIGLNFYRPQEAAPGWRGHEYRSTLADRVQMEAGVLESALSVSESRGRTDSQGDEPLTFTPATTDGNYFLTQDRRARRVQWAEAWSAPARRFFGSHTVRAGGALTRTTLDGNAWAREVEIRSRDGGLVQLLPFRNQPAYRLTDWDGGVYVQDGWEPARSVRIDAGLRVDRQRLARATVAAPRLGLAWTPGKKDAGTVVRGGLGWFYDRVPLTVFAFPNFPWQAGLPNRVNVDGGLAPRSRTASVAIDHRFHPALLVHAGYLQSSQSELLVLQSGAESTLLAPSGRARTRELELTAKLSWYAGQSWIVSYTHTRGRGNLNTFDRFLGDTPDPLLRPDLSAGLPGILPHRFLTWGVFPLRYSMQFAPVVEWRSGFPYSSLDGGQQYAGIPNTLALPRFFSLDLRLGKEIAYRKHKVRLSFSMFNVTNYANFDAVRWNIADPQFGEVLGRRPRRFRLDFDWLF
jgi:hypothetical protein